jgi:molybdate transport system substrate-binding protein
MQTFKIGLCVAALFFSASATDAAEIKLLSTLNMMPVFKTLTGEFERASGHRLIVTFDEAVPARNRILAGEGVDATINLHSLFEECERQGKLVEGSGLTFGHSTISVVVGLRAPQPDISSARALKSVLLEAATVTYGNPAGGGAAGIVVSGMLEQLGISRAINAKAMLARDGREVVALVASGKAQIGMTQTTMARSRSDVSYVGTLPRDALSSEVWGAGAYTIGIVAGAVNAEAARSLVAFMSSDTAVARLKAAGMEP